jgi:predicted LPLAT superfamily acyltransferase
MTNFSPCLLIPIYNHKDAIGATVAALAPYGLPIYVVDDGSDQATRATLARLAAHEPLIRLHRLAVNSGKGAAAMAGMRLALADGHSHALQIDADGQHNPADVPRFLACARAMPQAVVAGKPVYDDSVPRGRLYGRYITHFWVWIETLSFAIGDSLCGFRLYPLAATCALIERVALPTRMDFDTEIIVRLFWDGLPVQNLETRVTYPAGGLSHFDMWRDNLRISAMHTRLTLGMLPRLPRLLWRHLAPSDSGPGRHWSRMAEAGTELGLRGALTCYRLLGRRGARALLVPVSAYFYCTRPLARRASRNFLQRVAQRLGQPAPRWTDSFRHMLAFSWSALDKVAAWSGRLDNVPVAFNGRAEFDAMLASGRGALLIGSHLGNLDMTRALARGHSDSIVTAVVFTRHAENFNRMVASVNPAFCQNLLHVSDFGPDTAIILRNKIERGELVVIVGDRTPPAMNGRTTTVDFLGAPAPFAQGPMILASLLECPVYLFFCLPQGDGYRIEFEPFAQQVSLSRKRRRQDLQVWVQRYAQRLEAHCLSAPLQWFNFHDFWEQDMHASSGRRALPAALVTAENSSIPIGEKLP